MSTATGLLTAGADGICDSLRLWLLQAERKTALSPCILAEQLRVCFGACLFVRGPSAQTSRAESGLDTWRAHAAKVAPNCAWRAPAPRLTPLTPQRGQARAGQSWPSALLTRLTQLIRFDQSAVGQGGVLGFLCYRRCSSVKIPGSDFCKILGVSENRPPTASTPRLSSRLRVFCKARLQRRPA